MLLAVFRLPEPAPSESRHQFPPLLNRSSSATPSLRNCLCFHAARLSRAVQPVKEVAGRTLTQQHTKADVELLSPSINVSILYLMDWGRDAMTLFLGGLSLLAVTCDLVISRRIPQPMAQSQ